MKASGTITMSRRPSPPIPFRGAREAVRCTTAISQARWRLCEPRSRAGVKERLYPMAAKESCLRAWAIGLHCRGSNFSFSYLIALSLLSTQQLHTFNNVNGQEYTAHRSYRNRSVHGYFTPRCTYRSKWHTVRDRRPRAGEAFTNLEPLTSQALAQNAAPRSLAVERRARSVER